VYVCVCVCVCVCVFYDIGRIHSLSFQKTLRESKERTLCTCVVLPSFSLPLSSFPFCSIPYVADISISLSPSLYLSTWFLLDNFNVPLARFFAFALSNRNSPPFTPSPFHPFPASPTGSLPLLSWTFAVAMRL
jgi:hypothetical protein